MFKFFDRRLERDIGNKTKERVENFKKSIKGDIAPPKDIEVNVLSHAMQRYAVWFGGSMLGTTPEFYNVCYSKSDYDEKGPSIARYSKVFNAITM